MKFFFVFFLYFSSLFAEKQFVVLSKDEVHRGDYFAASGSVEVSGVVKGDVYVFGSQITIDGTVEGDVIATGANIVIAGNVDGNARLIGGQVEVSGLVKRNATVIGGNLQLASGGMIGGNAVFTGGLIDLSGTIGNNLTATASALRFSGSVKGNVLAHVGSMRLNSEADIRGNLEYSSTEEAQVESGAEVRGKISYHPSVVSSLFGGKWKKKILIGSKFIGFLMNFLFIFVLGWVFIKFFPRRLKSTQEILDKKKWKAFWIGVLLALLLPVFCLVLFITILGFPFGLALLAISIFGFYSAKIFPIIWISNKILSKFHLRKNSVWLYFWGLLFFFLFTKIPFFGGLISLIFIFLGLGAIVLSRIQRRLPNK